MRFNGGYLRIKGVWSFKIDPKNLNSDNETRSCEESLRNRYRFDGVVVKLKTYVLPAAQVVYPVLESKGTQSILSFEP